MRPSLIGTLAVIFIMLTKPPLSFAGHGDCISQTNFTNRSGRTLGSWWYFQRGAPINLTCPRKGPLTFYSTSINKCKKVQLDLSNFTHHSNDAAVLFYPTNSSFVGNLSFACGKIDANGTRGSHAKCILVDVGDAPKLPEIACTTTDFSKIVCRMKPSIDEIEKATKLLQPRHKFNSSFVFRIGNESETCRKHDVSDQNGCVMSNDSLTYRTSKHIIDFSLTVSIENVVGHVSKRFCLNTDDIFVPEISLAASSVRIESVTLNWSVTSGAFTHRPSQTEIRCTSLHPIKNLEGLIIHDSYKADISPLRSLTMYKCKARIKFILINGPGLWSEWSRTVIFFTKAINIPKPVVYPGMVHLRNKRCRFYIFNISDNVIEYSVEIGDQKEYSKTNVDFSLPCPTNLFSTPLRVSARYGKKPYEVWSNYTVVPFSADDISSTPPPSVKKISENRYNIFPAGGRHKKVKNMSLIVCHCQSCSTRLAKCKGLRRIMPSKDDPRTFKNVAINFETELIAVYTTFEERPHYSLSSWYPVDFFNDSYPDGSSPSFWRPIIVLILIISISSILIIVAVAVFARKRVQKICSTIFHDPSLGDPQPTPLASGLYELHTYSANGTYSDEKGSGPMKSQPKVAQGILPSDCGELSSLTTDSNPYYIDK